MYTGVVTADQTFTVAAGSTITGCQVLIPNPSQALSDSWEVKVSDAAVSMPLGVAQVDPDTVINAGELVTARIWGITRVRASKAIAYGAHLSALANGMVTDAAPGAGKFFCGYAWTSASQLGDEILMLIDREVDEA